MVYIEQASDAQVDTTSSDDKSSEEVEDVSENLKFLFFYGLLDLNWLHFDWVAFFFLHWIMPLVLKFELPELCNLFQNIGEGV
jgi:hypothetical protein